MFSNASNFVHGVDNAFLIILGISFFFLITLTGTMIYFVVRYNRKRNPHATQIKDSTWLEVTWTTIPLLLVLLMFYVGWAGFLPMRVVPKDAMHIKAIGKMWKYSFEYEGNKQSDTLVVPLNKAVKIDLVSLDVLHGFSIPAFRIKEDMVPYKKNYTWFIPGEKGDYDLFCTVYCGVSHSYMYGVVRVVDAAEFDKWLDKLPVKTDDTNLGYKALEKNGCVACHSVDGTKIVGPTFKGLYGSSRAVTTNGQKRTVTANEDYVKTSIIDPDKDVVDDYPPSVMKSYKGNITDKDIQLITDYLKTLK